MSPFAFIFLGILAQVSCQPYEPHYEPTYKETTTITETKTVTVTHTLRETTTTDVWITDHTDVHAVVTDYTTAWDFHPDEANTRTSIVKITSKPVVLVTATTGYNPVKTFVSVFTEFLTTTETIELLQSITHISVQHKINTIPVVTTQELVQQITTTTTYIITTTITPDWYY
ncbi:uncharacterized protein [Panulirus ornatus]|uniref:uncharacterized protein n=1 Tax=Panulirus ornatus TaxID=150431 RepID=UPI003A868364